VDDDAFLRHVADRLSELPGVEAVTLGGSRAEGTNRPDSDWDFSIYYRGRFDPQTLRDIGWPGEVCEVGGWSRGVFNGGAWLEIDGRRADVHYRDLVIIDQEIAASREGRFDIEPLMFHVAGIPSYLVLAELAVKRVLHGELPTPDYPVTLRERAPRVWWDRAERTFDYARINCAPYGRLAQCAGLVAQATSYAAHAVLAARGQWVTNEKTLLTRAGLRKVDEFIAAARSDPGAMRDVVDKSRAACSVAVREAKGLPAIDTAGHTTEEVAAELAGFVRHVEHGGPEAPTLRGPRVTIRPGGPDDIAPLRAALADESVARWWGEPEPADQIAAELRGDGSSVLLVVEMGGQVAGGIQYHEEQDPMYRHAGIDIFLGRLYQGQGAGAEAIGLLARFLFGQRGHHRITIDPAAANQRAIRCYTKVGFRPVGIMRRYERGTDGRFHDGLLMDLIRDDLPAVTQPGGWSAGR
jgi:RimJ/RimL family protein N-acetyltransferase